MYFFCLSVGASIIDLPYSSIKPSYPSYAGQKYLYRPDAVIAFSNWLDASYNFLYGSPPDLASLAVDGIKQNPTLIAPRPIVFFTIGQYWFTETSLGHLPASSISKAVTRPESYELRAVFLKLIFDSKPMSSSNTFPFSRPFALRLSFFFLNTNSVLVSSSSALGFKNIGKLR